MDYSPDTVFITGQARPAKEDAISLVHGVFYLGLIVDRKTGRIEDAQCNTILPMTDRFVHSLIVGKRLVEDMEELEKIIRSRYFALTQRALLALLSHGLDGNSIEQMEAAKAALEEHLINR